MKKEFPIHLFVVYCPDSGELKIDPCVPLSVRRALKVGYSRGATGTEYGVIRMCRQLPNYKLSEKQVTHLAWKLKTGEWPNSSIRFIDGNHKNLKWQNLRLDGSEVEG